MDYLTVEEAGEKWGSVSRMVTLYCNAGPHEECIEKGNLRLISEDTPKPQDL